VLRIKCSGKIATFAKLRTVCDLKSQSLETALRHADLLMGESEAIQAGLPKTPFRGVFKTAYAAAKETMRW
jgi:hypothetical protein